MSITYFYPNIRIDYQPLYLSVQVLKEGRWMTIRTFDVMSDDYAYTNAREYAEALNKETV